MYKLVTLVSFMICHANAFEYGVEFMKNNLLELIENNRKNLSEACTLQWDAFNDILGNEFENNWAWQMVDANAKLNSGLLRGNLIDTGNMDECLAVDAKHNDVEIKGKYCLGAFNIPFNISNAEQSYFTLSPFYSMALCIPHKCTVHDMFPFLPDIEFCQTAETLSEFDAASWTFLGVIIAILLISLLSSFYDYYLRCKGKEPLHPICLAFSLCTNGKKLLSISNNPDQMNCIHGLRTMSMLWVVTGHRFSASALVPMINLLDADQWTKEVYSLYIMGAPMAVDTFFFLAGLLISYNFMKSQSKPRPTFNIPMYYLHRYLRLTPALAMVIFMYSTIWQHITRGPMWPMLMELEKGHCEKYWHTSLLYIQNIVNPDDLCLPHTWYLSVDMQIFILSPIVLILMVKFKKYAGYGLIGGILFFILPPALITYFLDITLMSADYHTHYYIQFYNRIGPWLVGVLLGYISFMRRDKKTKIHWCVNFVMWILALGLMFVVVYLVNKMNYETNISLVTVFHGFHRTAWALGLMWIVFACQNGYGGIINWFLSLPIFQVMGKLSYSMYLLHMPLQMQAIVRKRSPQYFDDYELLNQAFGDIIAVSFMALMWCLFFESPMIIIEKILFGKALENKHVTTETNKRSDSQ